MAGIGFQLQKILGRNTYRSLVQAYVYSALVSAGPWLLAILGLSAIGMVAEWLVGSHNVGLFRCIVAYTYAGTLVLTGTIQMGTTRYVADRLFVNDTKALRPCFHWVSLIVILLGGVASGVFHAFAGLGLASAVASVVLFQTVSLTWVGMIFLSAAKDYMAIVRAFTMGYAVSVAGALWGAMWMDLRGMLWGFTAGQVVLALLLGIRVRAEFPSDRNHDAVVRNHWRTMPHLLIIGLFYNLGIWVDKLIFWLSPRGEQLEGWFYTSPRYDTCIFMGYVTIVPAMALFLIRIETGFYKRYAAFYAAITQGGDLASIRAQKEAMVGALRLSAARLLKLQGAITLGLVLLTPFLLPMLNLPEDWAPTMRIGLLAAFVQVLVLILFVVLLYFDWQRVVAFLALAFAGLNALLTWLCMGLGERWHGLGYLLACLITLVAGLVVFEKRMAHLERETFTNQPMRG